MRLVPRNGSREVAEAPSFAGFGVPARTCASGEGGRRGDREVARWAVACVAAETGALLPDSAGAEGGATAREKDGKDASAAATRTRVFVDAGRLLGEVLAARLRGYPTDAEEDADLARQYGEELAAMDGAASLEAGTGLAEEATARRVGSSRAKMATEFRAGGEGDPEEGPGAPRERRVGRRRVGAGRRERGGRRRRGEDERRQGRTLTNSTRGRWSMIHDVHDEGDASVQDSPSRSGRNLRPPRLRNASPSRRRPRERTTREFAPVVRPRTAPVRAPK